MKSKETTTQEQQKAGGGAATLQPGEHEGLAEKFGVQPKTVGLVREVVAEVLAAGDSRIEVTPEIERLIEQAADKRLQELVVIVRDLIERATGQKLPKEQAAEKNQLASEETEPSKYEREAVTAVCKAVGCYHARFQHDVLSALMSDVSKTTDAADKLIEMEDKVRAVCDRLSVRTKAVITILEELSAVEGYGLDVDYGNEILWEELRDEEHVAKALEENPDDADLALLAEVYVLAKLIRNSDGINAERVLDSMSEAEQDEAPGETEQEPDSDDDESERKYRGDKVKLTISEEKVKRWLLDLPYEAKLAHVILSTMCIADSGVDEPAWGIVERFADDVEAVLDKGCEGMSKELTFATGVAGQLMSWHAHL